MKLKLNKQPSFYFLLNEIGNCRKKINTSESGFSLLEVLVTILVVTGFLLGSLQATVLATLLRVQATDKQEANNWIQKDLDLIKYQASTLDSGGANAAACTASTYGTRLRNTLTGLTPAYSTTQGIQIDSRSYRVFRDYTPIDNTLQLVYTVAYAPAVSPIAAHPRYNSSSSYTVSSTPAASNPNVVANLTTEVIPNAVLSCP